MRGSWFLAAMVVCFAIAALAFGGVILRDDMAGRMIFGVVWALLGIVWLGRLVQTRRAGS